MKPCYSFWRAWIFGLILAACVDPANALAAPANETDDKKPAAETEAPRLAPLGLEKLMDIEVTTVTRSESTVGQSPAAIHVITQEDIRRAGATTITELFRRVPGLDVARIDNNKWAISARGFNDRYADMLLVQVDGRTVYNPLYTGVYWDSIVYPLDDIERIEVIRGPGASVWGANAVNGIINIITKSAKDTQGGLLKAGGGNQDLAFGTLRYGDKIGEDAFYRIYGEGFDRWTKEYSQMGDINDDEWYVTEAGSRVDWNPSQKDSVLFDMQYNHTDSGRSDLYPKLTPPFSFRDLERERTDAGHVLGRLTHSFGGESSLTLQVYWDHFEQMIKNLRQHFRWDTYDLDFQHQFPFGERQKIIYGFEYRFVDTFLPNSAIDDGFIFTWGDNHRDFQLYSGFVQDQITLIKDRFSILLGSKFEHNDFTGWEIQPTGRLLWTPTNWQSAWFSVSRAVRNPSLLEDEILLTLAPVSTAPVVVFPRLTLNKNFESEEVIAYELGYRAEPAPEFSFDLALFYNDYRRLRMAAFDGATPGPGGSLIVPLIIQNRMRGETYGVEVAADWRPVRWWRFYGAYSFLEMQLHADPQLPAETRAAAESAEGHSPQHQVYLQSSWDLGKNVEFDLMGRYVSRLTGFNPTNIPGTQGAVPSYVSLDARLAWRPLKKLEVSVVGQNLLDDHHPEFISSPQGQALQNPVVEIRRSVYGMVKWEF